MKRLLFVVAAAILTACVIHIVSIFLVPKFATKSVWHRSLALGEAHQMQVLGDPFKARDVFPELDPTFAYGVCRVSIDSAPVHLSGVLGNRFWSLNYLDPNGRSQFSLTNQISGSELNVVLASKGQLRLLAEKPDLTSDTAVTITAVSDDALLFLRAFVEQESERAETEAAIKALKCEHLWPVQAE